MADVEAARDALLVRFGEDAAEGLDRLIRAVEKRCAERIRATALERLEVYDMAAIEAADLIDPDKES
jgi:hypothetical protein